MNKRQLLALGVPEDCVRDAVACIHAAAKAKMLKTCDPKKLIPQIIANAELYTSDAYFGDLAKAVVAAHAAPPAREPVEYRQWGEDIDDASRTQMRNACRLPVATAGALMPDAHVG
jgi:tRNA-splicing ligase RtcB